MAYTRYAKWGALALFIIATLALQQNGISGALVSFVTLVIFAVLYARDETALAREADLRKFREQEEPRSAEQQPEKSKKKGSAAPAAPAVPVATPARSSAAVPEPNTIELKTIVYDRAAEEHKLLQAVRDGDLAAVTALVEQGVSVDAESQNGITALMFAAKFKRAAIVGYLIEQGADVNKKARNGLTAMRIARELKDQELMDLLSAGGALD